MKTSLFISAAVASSVFLLVACGGAKDSDLFGTPSADLASTTDGTDPAPPATGTDPGTSTSSTSSTSGGGSSTSSGGSTSSSGGSTSSSGGSTSSSGGSSSGGSTSSSGGTSTSSGIYCGEENGDDVYCKAGTACCIKDGGGFPTYECVSNGWGCSGGLAIKCNDQTDCPTGNVCCGMFEENSGYKSVSCSLTCVNAGTLKGVRLCDPDAATDECAAIGKSCQWSGSLPGYSVCK